MVTCTIEKLFKVSGFVVVANIRNLEAEIHSQNLFES